MKKKVENKVETTNFKDIVLWILVAAFLIGGFIANQMFISYSLPIRLIGWVIVVCLVVLLAFQTHSGKKFWSFFKDSRNEMRKVVWPNRQQTFQTTMVVIGIIIVFALVMWGLDAIIQWGFSFIIGG